MTTTTPLYIHSSCGRRGKRAAFTLVEVIIGSSLATFILSGVLSTFLFMGRTGANLANYSDMESQARRSLELFANDVRQASAISWTSSTAVTLTVGAVAISYAYDSSNRSFTRTAGATTRTLITGITSGSFALRGYNLAGAEMPLSSSAERVAASSSTKQLQISLEASRTTRTVATASNLVLSARYILRNKIVTA